MPKRVVEAWSVANYLWLVRNSKDGRFLLGVEAKGLLVWGELRRLV